MQPCIGIVDRDFVISCLPLLCCSRDAGAPEPSCHCRGKSDSNQCGVPLNGTLIRPKTVRDLPSLPIAGIFAGHRHSAAILEDGSVYTWGRNTNGELGIGRRSDSEGMPRMIQQLDPSTRFSNVAIGDTHMLFIDQNGSMWAAGSNDWGQLGLGSPLQSLNSEFDKPRISKRSARFGESNSMPVMVMRDHMNSRVCTSRCSSSTGLVSMTDTMGPCLVTSRLQTRALGD